MGKIIFISVHPDDETLGCGGTILKHKKQGDEIYWLILTKVSEKYGWSRSKVRTRHEEIKEVKKQYRFNNLYELFYPPGQLDSLPIEDLITDISKILLDLKPDIIFLPNRSDIHSDHQIAFKSIISSTKNYRNPYIKKILMYETLSETEYSPPLNENSFQPNVFIDITNTFEEKCKIMNIYKSEVMLPNLPRSIQTIEAVAMLRGSRIGVKYAESFSLLFEIS